MAATNPPNDATTMPALGYGTWKADPGVVGESTIIALNSGVRYIDCAELYGNEAEIGEALEKVFSAGEIKREDVWITSKVWSSNYHRIREACLATIKALRVEYLDLYLLHSAASWRTPNGELWNVPDEGAYLGDTPIHVAWEAMEQLVLDGLVREIGISNFPALMVHDTVISAKRVKPKHHQIEVHPYLQQKRLCEFSVKSGLHVTAYSPLGNASGKGPLHDPVVAEIAERHQKQPAQVLLKWNVQKGNSVLFKSTNESRIQANLALDDFELSEEEMARLDALECGARTCSLQEFWKFPYYE